jgi:hypothetical protein
MANIQQAITAIVVALAQLLSIFMVGELMLRICRVSIGSIVGRLVCRYWVGAITYGGIWFIFGLLHLLRTEVFVIFSMVCVAAFGFSLGTTPRSNLWVSILQVWKVVTRYRILFTILSIYGILMVMSCFRLLPYGDEIQYLWPSPLHWAKNSTWISSPFRHSDGPILWNVLHTIPALFESNSAAHLLNLSVVPVTCLSAVMIGKKLRIPLVLAGAIPLGIPAFMSSASTCSTDVPSTGLTVYALYLGIIGLRQLRLRNLSIPAILIFASLYSVKLTAITVLLPFSLLALRSELVETKVLSVATLKPFMLSLFKVAYIPVLLSMFGWAIRTFVLTGQVYDNRNVLLATGPDHWLWHTGGEVARIPNMAELLVIPVLPLILPIIGQVEPYGSRTGLACLLLIPAVVSLVRHRTRLREFSDTAKLAVWIIGSTWVTYCLVSLLIPKPRFSGYVWPVISIASVALVNQLFGQVTRRVMNFVAFTFVFLSIVLDEARIQVMLLLKVMLQ